MSNRGFWVNIYSERDLESTRGGHPGDDDERGSRTDELGPGQDIASVQSAKSKKKKK